MTSKIGLKIRLFIFILMLSITIIFLSFFYEITSNNIIKTLKNTLVYSKAINSNTCYPIKRKSKEFSIKIAGVSYPKYLKLTRNQSIDFDFLNRGEIKKILFWNPFFSSKDYYYGLGKKTPFINNNCPVVNFIKN